MLSRSSIWPATASVLLHGALVVFIVMGWESAEAPTPPANKPQYIEAKLVELKPKAKQAAATQPKQVQKVDLTKQRREKELAEKRAQEQRAKEQQQAKLKREKAEQQAQQKKREQEAAAERQRQAERKRQEEKERQRRQAEALEQALQEEQGLILEDKYETEAQSYMQAISERIEQNWSRPSSARNNMEAVLAIQLVPTGRVVNVSVVKSSGNAAFDRSAEQAVRQVETFAEVKDMPSEVFERHYRRFNLRFKPQDLRQ